MNVVFNNICFHFYRWENIFKISLYNYYIYKIYVYICSVILKHNIMNTQKFFNVELVFVNFDHKLGRGVIELFLQHFFNSELKGRELTNMIGSKRLFIVDIKPKLEHRDKWWEETFAVTMIRDI